MPQPPLDTDPRFWVLSEALTSYAADADDPPIGTEQYLQAAVSLVLRARARLEILLIKRARSERDPWSGHMALPGGRRDAADADLLGTATRETLEETGVDLERDGSALGRLEVVAPSGPSLPKLTISPFVFGLSAEADARVASPEVEQVFWVPLDELRTAQAQSTVNIQFPGGSRAFACYRVAGEIVWGLTYRILHQFLRVYPEGEPEEL